VFGVIALCSAYGEGALADWGALHLHADLHASIALAAAGYAAFSAAMVVGRSSGTWLLSHAGRTVVLTGGALTAAVGMLVAALVPVLPIAILGFMVVGLGLANLFPAAVGQAGALMGRAGSPQPRLSATAACSPGRRSSASSRSAPAYPRR